MFLTIYEPLIINSIILAVAAISLWVSLRAGLFNLSIAGMMALSAYASAVLTVDHEINWVIASAIGVLASAAVALVLGIVVLRLSGHFLAIATLGFGAIVQSLALNLDGVTNGSAGLFGIPSVLTLAASVVILAAVLWIVWAINTSRIGREWSAVRVDDVSAAGVGINVFRVRLQAFVLSAVLAGLAGAMFAQYNRVIVPGTFGFHLLVDVVVFCVVGGVGSLAGPLLGTALINSSPEWLAGLQESQDVVVGVLLVVVIVFFPGGLVSLSDPIGRVLRERESRRRQPGADPAADDVALGLLFPDGGEATEKGLAVDGVGQQFAGLVALKDVSLTVRPGEVHALVGPNGAGKTTLMNAISGYRHGTDGSVSLGGARLSDLDAHVIGADHGLRRVYQHSRLQEDATVVANVLVGLAPRLRSGFAAAVLRTPRRRREERDARTRALAALALVGMTDRAGTAIRSLSYGEKRKVEVARALVAGPRVLLLDEPAAGLTEVETEQLSRLIRAVAKRGACVLLVEHNVPFIEQVADVVTVLDFGERIAHGTPAQVTRDPAVVRAYLGEAAVKEEP